MKTQLHSPTLLSALMFLVGLIFYPILSFYWVNRCLEKRCIEGIGFLILGVVGCMSLVVTTMLTGFKVTNTAVELPIGLCGYLVIGLVQQKLISEMHKDGIW